MPTLRIIYLLTELHQRPARESIQQGFAVGEVSGRRGMADPEPAGQFAQGDLFSTLTFKNVLSRVEQGRRERTRGDRDRRRP